MKRKSFLFQLIFLSPLILGCSSVKNEPGVKTIYDSKSEAEKAAKVFNCSGAHRMGDKWMPCKKHGNHKNLGNHHNHDHN